MTVLMLAANAQSHYTVWHDAKAVTFIDDCETVHDVDVILNNNTDQEVEFSVLYEGREWNFCFKVDTIIDTEDCKTTYRFKNKSTMTMFHTDNGEICKFTMKIPDSDPYEKVVFLFYM